MNAGARPVQSGSGNNPQRGLFSCDDDIVGDEGNEGSNTNHCENLSQR